MSGKYQIIYWRDIPSQIKAKIGRKRLSKPLHDRFMQVIDAAAMQSGDTDTDDYLAQWRTSEWQPIEGNANAFLDALVAQIEAEYSGQRLSHLVKAGGWETT